jgi:hypothetical protein
MSTTGPVAEFALGLADLFEPLLDRLSTPEDLEFLFSRYGWRVELDDTAFAALSEGLAAKDAVQDFLAVATPLRQQLAGGATSLGPDDVAALARALDATIEAVAGIQTAARGGLPAPLDAEEFWTDIGEHLLDDLLEEYLRIYHPVIYVVLLAAGVVRHEPTVPEGAQRRPYRRIVVDWSQAGRLAEDPSGTLQSVYRWGGEGEPLDHVLLIDVLERALRALRVATHRPIPGIDVAPLPASSPYRIDASADGLRTTFAEGLFAGDGAAFEIGLQLLIAARASDDIPTGVILSPVVRGRTEGAVRLGGLTLSWKAAVNAGELLGVAVFPATVELAGGDAAIGASLELADPGTTPRYLFGSERTARLEISRPSLRLSIEGQTSDPEARLELRAGDAANPGARLVVPLGDADTFVKKSVPANALDLKFTPEIIWSSRTGLTFNGRPTLDVDLALATSFTGVRIRDLHLVLRRSGQDTEEQSVLELEASTGVDVKLGPVLATMDRLGLRIGLDFGGTSKNVGFADVSFGLKPPSALGLAIDAGPVTGGGVLAADSDRGQYAGEVHLQFERIVVRAVGLLTTRLPDGKPGFSLLVIVTAEFTPVQLGLGFRLVDVGGLLGINRTVAVDALRAGLKTGALGAVLSPPDPKASVGQLVASLAGLFPPAAGRHVFAPTARIVWGSPTLITIDLALVLELPAPVRLVALGRLRAVLPDERKAIVRLQVDALGVIDFDRAEAAVDATLVDSRLAQFALTGDMALRVSWGDRPSFLLAVGGFHPRFAAPPGFPELKRIAVPLAGGDNPKLRLEAYLALTSNTVQFGARVDLAARAGKFGIAGFLTFDALVTLEPLAFEVDIAAKLAVKMGGRTLLSVSLSLTLSGPQPWRAHGRASFSILFFDVSFRFDVTIGDATPAALPAPVDVAPLLIAALADARAWTAQLPGGADAVTLRKLDPGTTVLAHPLATLQVRQRVAPLERTLDRFGSSVPSGARRFRITLATIGGVRTTIAPLQDRFAPAQFTALSDDAKLSAPSFEEMVSGAALGADGYATGPAANVGVVYEQMLVTAPGIAEPRSQKLAMPADVFGTLTATPPRRAGAFAVKDAA